MSGATQLIVIALGVIMLGIVVILVLRGGRAVMSAAAPHGPSVRPCPDCGKPVSLRAKACPQRGAAVGST